MAFTSIALILLSAFCHALWNFYSKSSRDTRILFFWCGFYTIIIAFIAFGIKQPVVPKPVWIYIAGSAFVHLLYKLSLTHAYTVGEISFVYPIARAAPAFLPLFAFLFLKERISVQGFDRHPMCDGFHTALPTTRSTHSVQSVLPLSTPTEMRSWRTPPWRVSLDTHS